MPGPKIRSDIVEVYVFARMGRRAADVSFLQLRRQLGELAGTWQPIMGHIEEGESAMAAAFRELHEETQLQPINAWQLEVVNSFFLARSDCIMNSPGFAIEVKEGVEPVLNQEHDAHRWVRIDHVGRDFLWPGQRQAINHILHDILPPDAPARDALRIAIP